MVCMAIFLLSITVSLVSFFWLVSLSFFFLPRDAVTCSICLLIGASACMHRWRQDRVPTHAWMHPPEHLITSSVNRSIHARRTRERKTELNDQSVNRHLLLTRMPACLLECSEWTILVCVLICVPCVASRTNLGNRSACAVLPSIHPKEKSSGHPS